MGQQGERYENLRLISSQQLSFIRSIYRTLDTAKFFMMFLESTDVEAEKLEKIVAQNDRKGFHDWIKQHHTNTLNELSILDLKQRARKFGVNSYSTMNRKQLLEAIIVKEVLNDKD